MKLEFEMRNVHDLAEEILGHIDKARDCKANDMDDRFCFELGAAWGSSSRLHHMLGEIADRVIYNKGDD